MESEQNKPIIDIDPIFLLEKTAAYSKVSVELLKLKALDKVGNIGSNLISRLICAIFIAFFFIMINIGLSLWLGELMGKVYYGFFSVALFYGVIGLILYFMHPTIKARLNDSIITEILK